MSEDPRRNRTLAAASTISTSSELKEYFFKVLVIGDACVGKTSFIERYVYRKPFKSNYKTTIGVDFAIKDMHLSDREKVRLQLWDLSGQDRYTNMSRVYYRDAIGCLLFFDLTRVESFRNALRWKYDLDDKVHLPNGQKIPCLLVGNKCDLEERPVPLEEIDAFCQKNGFTGWIEVSVKKNYNLDKTARVLSNAVLEELKNEQTPERKLSQQRESYIRLNNKQTRSYKRQTAAGCCSGSNRTNTVV